MLFCLIGPNHGISPWNVRGSSVHSVILLILKAETPNPDWD